MADEYRKEIEQLGGAVPECREDPMAMQIAKLQDAWRLLQA